MARCKGSQKMVKNTLQTQEGHAEKRAQRGKGDQTNTGHW